MKRHAELYKIFTEDILLALSILLLAGALIVNQLHREQGQWVLIYKNNLLLFQADLRTARTIRVGKMLIEIKDRRVHVRRSDCPRQICAHEGWISQQGQTLVCVPNHVLIEIDVSKREEEISLPLNK